jgi:hypothetical protein
MRTKMQTGSYISCESILSLCFKGIKFKAGMVAGMENVDEETKRALLDFGYHLAVGDLEEAFRAVKAIRNPAVWRNLALLSIKSRNLDVAEHCLGHMEHVRGARSVREARELEVCACASTFCKFPWCSPWIDS